MDELLERLKLNLIISHSEDDSLLQGLIIAAVDFAESYQHLGSGYYGENEMSETTKQAIIMLASHWYESRDGGTGGFFGDNVSAGESSLKAVKSLLRLDRDWKV